ncbi:MAG TPA: aminotransferase class V-fold PLP-dependent enzyme [Polyangiaceae bacterium]|nr:aminotransferase class V-fold PLP-dependent enzyme [Polyangiaceae bacterium]
MPEAATAPSGVSGLSGSAGSSGPPSEAALLAQRDEFPTLKTGVHLISHSLGAMPRGAREHAQRYLDEWEHESILAWHTWLPAVRSLGDLIGSVLGVDAGTVSLHANVSTVQSIVASCFSFEGPRNKIVYDDLNFSTVHYVWQEQARRGAEIVVVPSRGGIHPPTEELLRAIDERTLLVPISHVLFRSSAMYDAQRIIARAHEVGAMVLLDCYQSAGTVPLALKAWNCDLACGGSVKWACGGPGAAYLYVRPDLLSELRPTATGWFSHQEPFAFDMGPMRYAEDPFRMVGGTMPMPAIYTARAGWEIVAQLGVPAIRAKSLRQTRLLREQIEARGFTVNTPREDEGRGGTICFDFPDAERVSHTLSERRFFHDYRPRCGLRVSPHFYTTDDELDAFMRELDTVCAGGATTSASPAY